MTDASEQLRAHIRDAVRAELKAALRDELPHQTEFLRNVGQFVRETADAKILQLRGVLQRQIDQLKARLDGSDID
jgi:hypothetical protein